MEYNIGQLLEQAEQEITSLNKEDKFVVKDLFIGHYWKKIPIMKRIQLGMRFFEFAKGCQELEVINKTTSNQQQYKKK